MARGQSDGHLMFGVDPETGCDPAATFPTLFADHRLQREGQHGDYENPNDCLAFGRIGTMPVLAVG